MQFDWTEFDLTPCEIVMVEETAITGNRRAAYRKAYPESTDGEIDCNLRAAFRNPKVAMALNSYRMAEA